MLLKLLGLAGSGLLSLTLMGMVPASSVDQDEPPPPKEKKNHGKKKEDGKKGELAKKKDGGPERDLEHAYNLLRRLRAEGQSAGRTEPRIREWTDHAVDYYRDGLRALKEGNPQLAHEYGAIAHDLARAVDHARNAALYDRADEDLPAPPGVGARDAAARRARSSPRPTIGSARRTRAATPGRRPSPTATPPANCIGPPTATTKPAAPSAPPSSPAPPRPWRTSPSTSATPPTSARRPPPPIAAPTATARSSPRRPTAEPPPTRRVREPRMNTYEHR